LTSLVQISIASSRRPLGDIRRDFFAPSSFDHEVWDVETISTALELSRSWRVHIPVVLAALCGLRRGEIAALRWRHVDLDRAQLSVTETAEQTKAGVRYKAPKNGKGRTVALPAIVVSELRAHRLRQAQDLLQLGVGLND